MRSCSSSVLVHESAEQVAPVDLGRLILATEGRFDSWIRRLQPERPMGTMSVVVGGVDPKTRSRWPWPDDQQPVQALGARRPHPALGLGVRVECLHRCDEPSAFSERNTSSKLGVNFASRLRTTKDSPRPCGCANSIPGSPALLEPPHACVELRYLNAAGSLLGFCCQQPSSAS
jgi:hypothetical protein